MYNALKYTERLEKAGFTREEAEATTHMVLETMTDNFSTKDDLKLSVIALRADMKAMEQSIRADMKAMEQSIRADMKIMELSLRAEIQELRAEMKQMESRLTLKLGGMLIAAIAVMEYLRSS